MSRDTKEEMYYRKAFDCAKRGYKDALSKGHAYSKQVMMLKNPNTDIEEPVLNVAAAINWTMHYYLPNWASSTWRMTRQGFKMLMSLNIDTSLTLEKVEALSAKMDLAKGLAKSERPKRTSAKRKKNITKLELDKIVKHALSLDSSWSDALIYWIMSSVATGLRPNEWREAELIHQSGRTILRSPNFKHNEVRSYAKFRDIDITDISEESRNAIENHMRVVGMMRDKNILDRHYLGCSYLLRKINKTLWPRRKLNIMLYTGRHQFSSNAKAEPNCSEEERAAMMGHATTKTSRERYGRRKSGSNGLTPEIANKDVLGLIKNPPIKRTQTPKNAPIEITHTPKNAPTNVKG